MFSILSRIRLIPESYKASYFIAELIMHILPKAICIIVSI
jgi:hypothetical protein